MLGKVMIRHVPAESVVQARGIGSRVRDARIVAAWSGANDRIDQAVLPIVPIAALDPGAVDCLVGASLVDC